MEVTHLIINYLQVEPGHVLVGATDNQRWQWETEIGDSGGAAFTFVWVMLEGDLDSNIALQETAHFHGGRDFPLKKLAINCVHEMLEIAWKIMEAKWSESEAYDQYFGFRLNSDPLLPKTGPQ